MGEQEEARAELKIRRLSNGWLLKSRTGWHAFQSMGGLLDAIEKALTQPATDGDSQQAFFHPDYPRERKP